MTKLSVLTDQCRATYVIELRKLGWVAASVFLLGLMYGSDAFAQTSPELASTPIALQPSSANGGNGLTSLSDESTGADYGLGSALQSGSGTLQTSLTAEQIIGILQDNPNLAEELKNQMADRAQQQGTPVDPSEISDEILFNQLAKNAQLRASVTTVLRARGVVSEDDLQFAGQGTSTAETSSPAGRRFTPEDSTSQSEPSSSLYLEEGTPGVGVNGGALSDPNSSRINRNRQSSEFPRIEEAARASTDVPRVIEQQAPFDLQSMHDLYVQLPSETSRLERFGSDVFVNRYLSATGRGISGRDTPLDVPVGPDYIVGPGDRLTIELWGGVTQTFAKVIDREGRILLPEAGAIQVAGLSLGKAQNLIEGVLKPQYRDAQVAVTVSGLRSVRVYVVGDVERPGGYDISSLATPLSALYAAGGPTPVGSLRTLLHYRGKQLVEQVDLYDFLLHGIRNGSATFTSGDTLLVPPAGPQVAISGAVKRQAIYELRAGDAALASVIDDAGGFTAAASLDHITIERIGSDHQRQTVTIPVSQSDHALAAFAIKDGDRITVESILPYSHQAVYLSGHVVRPGRLPYTEGMRLHDVLHSYQDMLPEPAAHGEIIRLEPPDLHVETIEFDVPDALLGKANVPLQPFDTIRIFGRYDTDVPMVTIRGEVLRPGKYPMPKGMTAAQLVRLAGGFKRDALLESADLTSYEVTTDNQVSEKLSIVKIGAAVSGTDQGADVPLKPGDILAIHQITNWTNIGESITIVGQVRYPGSYGFQDGERLSSVLRRAGSFLPTAYPMGAVLVRVQVKALEQSSRDELVRQIEANSAAARLSPGASGSNAAGAMQLIKAQQDQVIAGLQSHPATGRMVINISADIDRWANTPADIELRPGDVLTIPKRPGFVLVTGQVYNVTALTFSPEKNAGWYLGHAGGANTSADRKNIFIIRANGSIVGRRSGGGMFTSDVLSVRLYPGDVVVVPQKIVGGSLAWRNLLATGQLAASAAITAGVAASAL